MRASRSPSTSWTSGTWSTGACDRPTRSRADRRAPARRGRLAAAPALALAVLAACSPARPPGPPERIALAVAQIPHAAILHVAIARGYLAQEGIDATVVRTPFGKPALEAVLAGKADVATCAETPFVLAVLSGAQVSWLATIESSTENTVLVARIDAGIAGPPDLAGKRIGFARGTNGEFFLDSLLVRHRIDRRTVELVDLAPAAMADAIDRHDVDAVAIWNPVSRAVARRLGSAGRIISAGDLYFETFGIVANTRFARERPAAAERLVRALVRAEGFLREHPQEARRLVAAEIGLDPGEVEASWSLFQYSVRLDQGMLPLLEEQARWAVRTGLAPRQETPNFLRNLDLAPMLAVRPEAVTVMR